MEIWKDISGYENKYQVSNFGRIKSLQRDVISGRGGFRTVKEKILKPKIDRYGYLTIDLRDQNQIRKTLKIHRLVAIAFISNPENKIQVNHKNESKTDNTIQNLEWTTPLQNSNYGTRTERSAKKRRNSSISKNVEQKDLNGNLIKVWPSLSEANRNGYHKSAISSCCLGQSATHRNYKWNFIND